MSACFYCYGYELNQGRIAVIASGAMSLHQAELIPEWGDVTFFTNGALTFDDSARNDLSARGVAIEETPIARLAGSADIILSDERPLSFAGILATPRNAPATSVAESLGCALAETPLDMQIRTDDSRLSSVPGVFACGEAARVSQFRIAWRLPMEPGPAPSSIVPLYGHDVRRQASTAA